MSNKSLMEKIFKHIFNDIKCLFKIDFWFSKNNIFFLLAILGFYILKEPINQSFEGFFQIFNNVKHWPFWVLLILLTIFLIYKLVKFSYVVSELQVRMVLLLGVFWVSFEFFNSEAKWSFIKYHNFPISYLGIATVLLFLFVLASYLMRVIWLAKIEDKKAISHLYNDESKSYTRFDKHIDEIVKAINISFPKSFSIAIVGPWGNGKTSLFESLNDRLKKEPKKYLNIRFSPFLNYGDKDIGADFFAILAKELKPYSGALADDIIQYSNALMSAVKSNDLAFVLKPFKNQKTVNELKESINTALKNIKPKVVVYIDDLDRLNGNEIVDVLKLIRNTAHFNNIIYLVAFDKEYVKTALSAEKQYMGNMYVEKFFNLEVYIPMEDPRKIIQVLVNEIEEKIELLGVDKLKDKQRKAIKNALQDGSTLFTEVITNYRDAKKILNQYIFETALLVDKQLEIDPIDLLHIIILKAFYPSVFYYVFSEDCELLKIRGGIKYMSYSKPKNSGGNEFKGKQTVNSFMLNQIEVNKNFDWEKDLKLITYWDKKIVGKILFKLFELRESLSIDHLAHIVTFEKYKALNLNKSRLRNADFEQVIKEGDIELLKNLIELGLSNEIFIHVEKFKENNTKEVLNLVHVLLLLVENEDNRFKVLNYIHLAVSIIIRKKRVVYEVQISINEIVEELKVNIFDSELFSPLTKAILLHFMCLNSIETFDKSTFQKLSENIFKEFIKLEEGKKWHNRGLLEIFRYLKNADANDANKHTILSLFNDDENQLKYYCHSTLVKDEKYGSWQINRDYVEIIFGSFEKLYDFISKRNKIKDLAYFDYYKKFLIMNSVSDGESKNFIWDINLSYTTELKNIVGEKEFNMKNKLKGVQVLLEFHESLGVNHREATIQNQKTIGVINSNSILFNSKNYRLLSIDYKDEYYFSKEIQNGYIEKLKKDDIKFELENEGSPYNWSIISEGETLVKVISMQSA